MSAAGAVDGGGGGGLSSREAAELAIVIVSFGVFAAYHVWLFLLRGRCGHVSTRYHDFFASGKLARAIWAQSCASDPSEAILGVQQARNAMVSCTYLATVSVAIATAGLTIIFDEGKMTRIEKLSIQDPILRRLSGPPLVPPVAIVAIALGSLYLSFILFGQSVRLWVHVGFYVRAVTSPFNPGALTAREAERAALRAGFAFTLGLRCFYAFVPLIMWSIGATALLVSSVLLTALIAAMDRFDMPRALHNKRGVNGGGFIGGGGGDDDDDDEGEIATATRLFQQGRAEHEQQQQRLRQQQQQQGQGQGQLLQQVTASQDTRVGGGDDGKSGGSGSEGQRHLNSAPTAASRAGGGGSGGLAALQVEGAGSSHPAPRSPAAAGNSPRLTARLATLSPQPSAAAALTDQQVASMV